MNENSSKQVLLSVIGIAVLVVAVVGVSFAFFTHSKTGTANNTLTTGSIFFNFTEGNTINLTNQFPMADSEGESLTVASNKALSFSVSGYDTSGKGIDYTVYALPGAPVDTRNRFKDDEIKLNLQTSANGTGYSNDFSTSKLSRRKSSLSFISSGDSGISSFSFSIGNTKLSPNLTFVLLILVN